MKFVILFCIIAICSGIQADKCVDHFQDLNFILQRPNPRIASDIPDNSPPEGASLFGVLISKVSGACGSCRGGSAAKCRGVNGGKTQDACAALDGEFKRQNLIKKAAPNKATSFDGYTYRYYVYLKNGEQAKCTL